MTLTCTVNGANLTCVYFLKQWVAKQKNTNEIPRITRWWRLKYLLCSPRNLGKWSNLTCAYFSDGLVKNHQLDVSTFWDKENHGLFWSLVPSSPTSKNLLGGSRDLQVVSLTMVNVGKSPKDPEISLSKWPNFISYKWSFSPTLDHPESWFSGSNHPALFQGKVTWGRHPNTTTEPMILGTIRVATY